MNRRATLAVCALSVVLVMITLLTCGFLTLKSGQNEIDTSWVGKLDEYLNGAKPYPAPPDSWDFSDHFIYLFEGGKSYLVEYSCGGTNLVAFLENLTDKADAKIDVTINEGFLDRITASDKVVSLTYRNQLISPSRQLGKVWFILQDNLNEGLNGTVVLSQTINNKEELSIWAILK
jgi:hypothetical protein